MSNEPLLDIEEQPDPKETANRMEAERITLHWKTGGTKVLPDYTKGPLFGSGEQFGMFGEGNE